MSVESGDNHRMLEEVYESRYGWSWIGTLATKTPEEGRAVGGAPKKKFHHVPNRPKTSDIGTPLEWVRGVRFGRAGSKGERAVLLAANRIIAAEKTLIHLEKIGNGSVVTGEVVYIPGLQMYLPLPPAETDPASACPDTTAEQRPAPVSLPQERIDNPWQPRSEQAWCWELQQRVHDLGGHTADPLPPA